jgi:hypothetical protein
VRLKPGAKGFLAQVADERGVQLLLWLIQAHAELEEGGHAQENVSARGQVMAEGNVRRHARGGVVVPHVDATMFRELRDSTSALNEAGRNGVDIREQLPGGEGDIRKGIDPGAMRRGDGLASRQNPHSRFQCNSARESGGGGVLHKANARGCAGAVSEVRHGLALDVVVEAGRHGGYPGGVLCAQCPSAGP